MSRQRSLMPNFSINGDKYLANYCVIFDDSEVLSVFDFLVNACSLRGWLGVSDE